MMRLNLYGRLCLSFRRLVDTVVREWPMQVGALQLLISSPRRYLSPYHTLQIPVPVPVKDSVFYGAPAEDARPHVKF